MPENDFLEKAVGDPEMSHHPSLPGAIIFLGDFSSWVSVYLMSSHHVRTASNNFSWWSDLVDTNSPWSMFTQFLSWWLKSGFMLITRMVLPGKALPEFPLSSRCRMPTLQLSQGVYPPIDHELKGRKFLWVDVCKCVCVCEMVTEKEHVFLLKWNRIYE